MLAFLQHSEYLLSDLIHSPPHSLIGTSPCGIVARSKGSLECAPQHKSSPKENIFVLPHIFLYHIFLDYF